MAYVTGLDVRNGSDEHSVYRQKVPVGELVEPMFQRTVFSLRDWTEAYRTSILTEFYPPWPLGFQGHDVASTGMATHEKYTCTANQTGVDCVSKD